MRFQYFFDDYAIKCTKFYNNKRILEHCVMGIKRNNLCFEKQIIQLRMRIWLIFYNGIPIVLSSSTDKDFDNFLS